jgi:hypothetical protein
MKAYSHVLWLLVVNMIKVATALIVSLEAPGYNTAHSHDRRWNLCFEGHPDGSARRRLLRCVNRSLDHSRDDPLRGGPF